MSWKKWISQGIDYYSGRFVAFEVRDPADRAEALEVLDQVRRVELNRVHGRSALESAAFSNAEVASVLLACRDTRTGKIVGCVRSTPADQIAGIPASREEYALDAFPEDLLPKVGIATRLAFLKDYRGSVGSLVLLDVMFTEGLRRGYEACVLTCEPGLYAMYLRLGFRPYGRAHASSTGGFRIPMVLPIHDQDYLDRSGSPLAKALRRYEGPRSDRAIRWYAEFVQGTDAFDPGIAAWNDEESDVHHALSAGLSADGAARLLDNAHEVACEVGQVVLREGDGGKGLGFVVEGLVEVRAGDRVVALLGEGELFGEIGAALDAPRAAALVAASPATRVLLLSQHALDRLDDADRARVWKNLAAQLAKRLVAANRR